MTSLNLIQPEADAENLGPHYLRATCARCGELKLVCCDDGYDENPDGTTTHRHPRCPECCHHPRRVRWGNDA